MTGRGRPKIAAETLQLPASTVSASMHRALVAEAQRRDVSVAQVVRDAVFSHLKNHPAPDRGHTNKEHVSLRAAEEASVPARR